MGRGRLLITLSGLLTLFALGALAQTNINSTAQPKRDGKVLVPDKPTSTDSANTATADQRPTRVERPPLSPEIQARIASFKEAARIYLEKEQALQKQIKGANDKERSALREQLKDLREQWLERSKEMRKEYKERQAELAEKLSEYRELLDSRGGGALQQSGGRPRRGDD